MAAVDIKSLLEAGAHFGHQTKRWNPKMKRFILCPRNGIYIIDLNKTTQNLNKFTDRIKREVEKGGKVLFVGTKKQIRDCVKEEAIRCSMPYVTERWLGGMLTNFQTIRQSISKLEKIEAMETDGTIEALPKKEVLKLMKKKEKLLSILDGIRHLKRTPAIVFVVDTIKEHIAVSEAHRLRVPIGSIVDTNSDPDKIDYPIPANDDAIKSVHLITKAIADAILEAKNQADIAAAEENVSEDEENLTASSEEERIVESEGEETEGVEEEDDEDKPRQRKRRVVKRKATSFN